MSRGEVPVRSPASLPQQMTPGLQRCHQPGHHTGGGRTEKALLDGSVATGTNSLTAEQDRDPKGAFQRAAARSWGRRGQGSAQLWTSPGAALPPPRATFAGPSEQVSPCLEPRRAAAAGGDTRRGEAPSQRAGTESWRQRRTPGGTERPAGRSAPGTARPASGSSSGRRTAASSSRDLRSQRRGASAPTKHLLPLPSAS